MILDDNTDSDRHSVYYQNAPGIDNKLGMNDGRAKYFMQDHLGSTVGLTNANGSWFETNSYDSFGNPSNNSFTTRYQFTGREFDTFSGLQYSRARFYDPQIGRFISEDPIGFAGGDVNLYGYVLNDPVNFNDPSGKQRPDRDRPGDQYPGMPEPYKPGRGDIIRDIACPLDGVNPWITFEVGGGLQFGPLGGSDGLAFGFNPLTFELSGQTKLMSGNGLSTGLLANAGIQVGLSLGPVASNLDPSPAAELFGDASAFGGGSGSLTYDGNFGAGVNVGPTVGGGAAGGIRFGEVSPLFSLNRPSCSCRR